MKLLRLNNGNNLLSQWSNFLNGLKIKPFSKIALQNISMEVNNKIVINDSNDRCQVQLVRNPKAFMARNELSSPIDVIVEHGEYLPNQLVEELNRAFNAAMDYGAGTDATSGMQFRISLSTATPAKMTIEYAKTNKSRLTEVVTKNLANGVSLPVEDLLGYIKTTGSGNTFDGWLYSKLPFSRSSGTVQARIRRLPAVPSIPGTPGTTNNSNWIFGLSNNLFSTDATQTVMNLVDFQYAFYSLGDGKVYIKTPLFSKFYWTDETNARMNMIMEISLGKIRFRFDRSGETTWTQEFDYDYAPNYNIAFCIKEQDNVELVDDPSHTPTQQPLTNCLSYFRGAFASLDAGGNLIEAMPTNIIKKYADTILSEDYILANDIGEEIGLGVNSYRFFYFGISRLGNILGYETDALIVANTEDGSLVGTYDFQAREYPTSLVLYVPNLKLDSYSSTTGKRENILAVLPDVTFIDNEYVYETNNPIFIDIDNSLYQDLDNLMVKIVSGDELSNQPLLLTDSGCTMTVLIDG